MAPIVRWSSFAADVGSQVTALSSHASRLWLRAAANACGTSLAGMISAGGGLVVRLEDPSLNACLITELAGAEHIVSAEEDMRMTVQG